MTLEKERNVVFRSISHKIPKFDPAELGFYRSINWLYCHYYEASKINIAFLIDRFPAYDLDKPEYLLTESSVITLGGSRKIEDLEDLTNHEKSLLEQAGIERIEDFLLIKRNDLLKTRYLGKKYLDKILVKICSDNGNHKSFYSYQDRIEGEAVDHYKRVGRLRTYLYHNLDPTKPRDLHVLKTCEEWIRRQCGTAEPDNDHQWHTCLIAILRESTLFLQKLLKALRGIERDEWIEDLLDKWNLLRKSYYPPHKFDELVGIVAQDMGREYIDPQRVRKRYYDEWIREITLISGDFDFEIEARKLIEHTLLFETTPVLPITGLDIMKEFNIPPGPSVGEHLERARKIFLSNPCPGNELLGKLRDSQS